MTEPVPPLSAIVPGLSVQLSNVVMRALERDPNQRFASCAQFGDALEAAATGKERIATPRELAAYVSEVMGEEVSAQREAVRAWIARSEPSRIDLAGVTPSSSVSAAAMSLSELDGARTASSSQMRPAPRRSRFGLALLLLLLLGAVGSGGFFYARQSGQNHSVGVALQPAAAPTLVVAAPAPTPITPPAPALTAISSAPGVVRCSRTLGTIAALHPERDHGFIASADGREIYFHRNSVEGDKFDDLKAGQEVRFAEAVGDKGPQATSVRPISKHHVD